MNPRLPRFREGDPAPGASMLDAISEVVARARSLRAVGGLTLSDGPGGMVLGRVRDGAFRARITSGSGPFSWEGIEPAPLNTWTTNGNTGTLNAWEYNARNTPAGAIVWMELVFGDEFRFYDPRNGTAPETSGCSPGAYTFYPSGCVPDSAPYPSPPIHASVPLIPGTTIEVHRLDVVGAYPFLSFTENPAVLATGVTDGSGTWAIDFGAYSVTPYLSFGGNLEAGRFRCHVTLPSTALPWVNATPGNPPTGVDYLDIIISVDSGGNCHYSAGSGGPSVYYPLTTCCGGYDSTDGSYPYSIPATMTATLGAYSATLTFDPTGTTPGWAGCFTGVAFPVDIWADPPIPPQVLCQEAAGTGTLAVRVGCTQYTDAYGAIHYTLLGGVAGKVCGLASNPILGTVYTHFHADECPIGSSSSAIGVSGYGNPFTGWPTSCVVTLQGTNLAFPFGRITGWSDTLSLSW